MAENMSPNVELDDLSVDITLSKPQGNLEEPFGVPGSVTDEEYPFLTPESKLASHKKYDQPSYTSDTSISGGANMYSKEGSENSPSSSSSDAESATSDQHANSDEDLQPKVINFELDTNGTEEELHATNQVDGEGMLEEKKEELYDKLLEKVANYEVMLKSTKYKLQSSEEEIARLKNENSTLVEELGISKEKLRICEDNMGKMEHDLRHELEQGQHQFQHQLDLANQSIDQLQIELGSERRLVYELQQMFNKTKNDFDDYNLIIQKLKLALVDAHKDASNDKTQFEYEISCLNEEKDALELKQKVLEEQINQYESEKIEAGKLHEAIKTALLDEIKQLKIELSQQSCVVETLNQNLDANNLKYDSLMAQKDEVLAKVQTLVAELNARDTDKLQMEERIRRMSTEHRELLSESENTKKLVEELRLKVHDQDQEIEKQRGVIHDCANEKREAIRQLCFSLEYYRNEYHQLRQVFTKCKQPAL
ncbi:unnamed protein product [Amaranthus hypochondriacus]